MTVTATPVKRYVVFSGEQYYPYGGWEDYDDSYDTLDEARQSLALQRHDWWQIVDLTTGEIVDQGRAK